MISHLCRKLSINFGGAPFRLNLTTLVTTLSIPTPRPPQLHTIIQRALMMPHITTRIISMIAQTPDHVCAMARVCHEWHTIITTPTHANALWQHVARVKWSHIPASTMKMASWQMFVKERTKALKQVCTQHNPIPSLSLLSPPAPSPYNSSPRFMHDRPDLTFLSKIVDFPFPFKFQIH